MLIKNNNYLILTFLFNLFYLKSLNQSIVLKKKNLMKLIQVWNYSTIEFTLKINKHFKIKNLDYFRSICR